MYINKTETITQSRRTIKTTKNESHDKKEYIHQKILILERRKELFNTLKKKKPDFNSMKERCYFLT